MPVLGLVAFLVLLSLVLAMRSWVGARPRERVLLLGARGPVPDAPKVRLLPGGGFPMPLLERAERLHVGPFAVQLSLPYVRCQGGRRVDVELDARVTLQVASEGFRQHGMEALLGRTPEQVSALVAVLLRGRLVAALSRMPPPESADPLLAEVFFSAAPLLDTLGLELDRDSLMVKVTARVE